MAKDWDALRADIQDLQDRVWELEQLPEALAARAAMKRAAEKQREDEPDALDNLRRRGKALRSKHQKKR